MPRLLLPSPRRFTCDHKNEQGNRQQEESGEVKGFVIAFPTFGTWLWCTGRSLLGIFQRL